MRKVYLNYNATTPIHPEVAEFTRPTYSSISFGWLPAAGMRVGWEIRVATVTSAGFGNLTVWQIRP